MFFCIVTELIQKLLNQFFSQDAIYRKLWSQHKKAKFRAVSHNHNCLEYMGKESGCHVGCQVDIRRYTGAESEESTACK